MKKTYIIPSAEAISFEVENMLAASDAKGTSIDGLGVDNENPTSEGGRVKGTTVDWEKWD